MGIIGGVALSALGAAVLSLGLELPWLLGRESALVAEAAGARGLAALVGQVAGCSLVLGALSGIALVLWQGATRRIAAQATPDRLRISASLAAGALLGAGLYLIGFLRVQATTSLVVPRSAGLTGLLAGFLVHRRAVARWGLVNTLALLGGVLGAAAAFVGALLASGLHLLLLGGQVSPPAVLFGGLAWVLSAGLGSAMAGALADWPAGRFARAGRFTVRGVGLCTATAALAAHHTQYVGLYPAIHLWLGGLALLTLLLMVWDVVRGSPLLGRGAGSGPLRWLPLVLLICSTLILWGFDLRVRPAVSTLEELGAIGAARRIWDPLLDLDDDGSVGAWASGPDCEDRRPDVGPSRWERPANGLDDNCSGGDLSSEVARRTTLAWRRARSEARRSLGPADSAGPRGVVLVTVDALRADRLGALTPNLRQLAARGSQFRDCHAPSSYTSLSLPAILRARYPSSLCQARIAAGNDFRFYGPDEPIPRGVRLFRTFFMPVADPSLELSQVFQKLGWRTGAVLDGRMGPLYQVRFGFGRGFDRWLTAAPEHVTARALSLVSSFAGTSFFVWIHYFDPHAATSPGSYDRAVAQVDQELGRLLQGLDALGRSASTLLVVSADHGTFLDQGGRVGHGFTVERTLTHVPLIFAGAGVVRRQFSIAVSGTDIAPTILDLLGLPAPDSMLGFSLARLVVGEAGALRPPVLSETWLPAGADGLSVRLLALHHQHGVLTWDPLRGTMIESGRDRAPTAPRSSSREAYFRELRDYLEAESVDACARAQAAPKGASSR